MNKLLLTTGKLYILTGLPGSGKSTLLENLPEHLIVSSDKLRRMLLGSRIGLDEYGSYESIPEDSNQVVFKMILDIIEEKARLGLTTFLDFTALTESDRSRYANIAAKYGMETEILIFDTPIEEVKENNRNRKKKVGNYVIDRMNEDFVRESKIKYHLISRETEIELKINSIKEDLIDPIGDIHGLMKLTKELLVKMGYTVTDKNISHPEGRKLLFLGDFIDRGPDSLEVVELIKFAVSKGHYAIIGNHEQKLITSYEQFRNGKEVKGGISGKITLMNLIKRSQKDQLSIINFLKSLPFYYTYEGRTKVLFTHANIVHGDPVLLTKQEAIYGAARRGSTLDTDLNYQELLNMGINKYNLIRGHIPQISIQRNVVSLEEEQAFEGNLVGGRLEKGELMERFRIKSDYNFDNEIDRSLLIGLESLIKDNLVRKKENINNSLFIYKYARSVFYKNLWHEDKLLLKARGLVLDFAGNVVQHSFDKIFNYGENDTGIEIDNNKEVLAVEKYNGFLGNIGINPFTKELLVTTSGSFEGDFVNYVKDFIDIDLKRKLLGFLHRNPMTLSFEVIHKDDEHIIKYNAEEKGLVLIGARTLGPNDPSKTEEELDVIAEDLGLKRAGYFKIKFGELKEKVSTSELEGFIVRDPECEFQTPLLKFKTPYYLVTKLIGRMGVNNIKFMYASPEKFKKDRVEEEFYEIVDKIIKEIDKETLIEMEEEEKIELMRGLIEDIRK